MYIGYTAEPLPYCFSKHCYNIKNRPENSRLATHFHENYNINDNIDIKVLQNNIKIAVVPRYHEDKWIYRLNPLAQRGLDTEIGECTENGDFMNATV